jgi:hypothetical protein
MLRIQRADFVGDTKNVVFYIASGNVYPRLSKSAIFTPSIGWIKMSDFEMPLGVI